MHTSVMEFLRDALDPEDIRDKRVLEVGSMDLNGSPRTVIDHYRPLQYLGVDTGPGRGVDYVCDAEHLTEHVGAFDWDLVVSTEMLEHAKDWRRVVDELKRAVAKGGTLVVTTRGPGFPYHAHPDDYWRFTPEDFREIFADFEILVLKPDPHPDFPGVFLKARRTRARYPIDLRDIDVAPVERP